MSEILIRPFEISDQPAVRAPSLPVRAAPLETVLTGDTRSLRGSSDVICGIRAT